MNNPTKNQHYIPQVYLRGFSPEYLNKNHKHIDERKYRIFSYNLNKDEKVGNPIPVKSICYEKDLYEIKDNNGKAIFTNFLEKWFCYFESKFSYYRSMLERKAFIEYNFSTMCFLKSEEKIFWSLYIVIQNLRMPQMLTMAEKVIQEVFSDKIDSNLSKTISKVWCLPFFKEIKGDERELDVFKLLLEPFENMTFAVGFDEKARIITSDLPFSIMGDLRDDYKIEYDRIMFPITAQICLCMFNKKRYTSYKKNCLFKIDEKIREEIFKNISRAAYERVYSNHFITEKEMLWISEIQSFRELKTAERRGLIV